VHLVPFIIWIVSLVLLFFKPYASRDWGGLGLFAFDLWLGLMFIIEAGDRITI
jgi:hypothetical protein